ncbi:MAG: AAA family ATPase [Muribaculaceae bacterium]|nr:AAA family ATPase [Muribaculaceae bacterium]
MLTSIVEPDDGSPKILNIGMDHITEFDPARGCIYFDSKAEDPDCQSIGTIQDFIKEQINLDRVTTQISLIKNCEDSLSGDNSVVTLLSTYASKYEGGDYNPLSTVILVSSEPVEKLPRTLLDTVKVIEIKAPSFNEIAELVSRIPISRQFEYIEDTIRVELSRNLQGLSLADIRHILRSCLVRTGGKLSRQTIALALEEKKQIVRKSGIIEVIDTDERLENIGGLENLIEEIRNKKVIFEHLSLAQSKKASVPLPKGVLIIGMPGCGKSMIAKAIASEFNVALLRLDINRLMGKYVGESESNLRRALETAEAAHPCVLWIDEIEKAFAGTDSGNNDIILRLMGHFLTWMQERKSAVYVIATANDTLKPEMMRKGRFDDVYFVDFPNKTEAESILRKSIGRYSDASLYDWSEIDDKAIKDIVGEFFAKNCSGFSGAEISSLVGNVVEAYFRKFIVSEDNQKRFASEDSRIKIRKDSFLYAVEEMRPHVMSNQLNDKQKDSAIVRISKLQQDYKLKSASKQ